MTEALSTHKLYADDLLAVGNRAQLTTAIEVIETWARERNMEVNHTKSGILSIDGDEFGTDGTMLGYPIVKSYKYLGMIINGKLDLKDHLKQINRKAGHICNKLYGLRRLDNLKLNTNLFNIFIAPHYRLAMTLYARQSAAASAKVDSHMRVWLKKFACIPINTASHTFELIAGDQKQTLLASFQKVRLKENARERAAGIVRVGTE